MKSPKWIVLSLLSLALLLSTIACTEKEPSYEDRETFAKETYVASGDTVITFQDCILDTAYSAETPTGIWLAGCSSSDRDDQFDAYVLRHELTADGHTTFTYLVYYPHGGAALTATPELLEGENGYVLHLTYTAGTGINGYSLCYLSVTLPTEEAPRLRLLTDGDALGVISTVTRDKIPLGHGD